jgi:hypothetical protein
VITPGNQSYVTGMRKLLCLFSLYVGYVRHPLKHGRQVVEMPSRVQHPGHTLVRVECVLWPSCEACCRWWFFWWLFCLGELSLWNAQVIVLSELRTETVVLLASRPDLSVELLMEVWRRWMMAMTTSTKATRGPNRVIQADESLPSARWAAR